MITTSIINYRDISPDLFMIQFNFPHHVQAGQFIMIQIPDSAYILPRPISIFDYDYQQQLMSLLVRKRGNGTNLLSKLSIGDSLHIFGALGKGFNTNLIDKTILCIGGGEGIAPFLLTSKTLSSNNQVSIFAGFRHDIESSVLDYFDQNLSIQYTAQDHSEQCHRGLVTDLMQDIAPPDFIYTCGPIPMMKAIYQYTKKQNWHSEVFVSMENHMACGVGACVGCVVKNHLDKPVKVCTDGPVFLASEVFYA